MENLFNKKEGGIIVTKALITKASKVDEPWNDAVFDEPVFEGDEGVEVEASGPLVLQLRDQPRAEHSNETFKAAENFVQVTDDREREMKCNNCDRTEAGRSIKTTKKCEHVFMLYIAKSVTRKTSSRIIQTVRLRYKTQN